MNPLISFFQDGTIAALRTLPLSSLWIYIASWIMDTPAVASLSTLFACASKEVASHRDKWQGAYIHPPNVVREQSGIAMDVGRQDVVWRFLKDFYAKCIDEGRY
jgi:hypothetical protein